MSGVTRGGYWQGFACILLASCGTSAPPEPVYSPHAEHLPEAPAPQTPVGPSADELKWLAAKDVLDARCVVCHGCYDAPCQLILGSHEGIERGASKTQIYDNTTRLLAIDPTRLFIDARTAEQWREKKFFSVLPDAESRDPEASMLMRMLKLKREHPLASNEKLPADIELGLDREQHCAADAEEFDELVSEHPSWGMPYGLPALKEEEQNTLRDWLAAGAPGIPPRGIPAQLVDPVRRWEAFFNDRSLKAQLSARYIYEHLFLASLRFDGDAEQTVFRLVRSRTPPGEPLAEVPTRRPTDDPGQPFFYRLVPQTATVLTKTNIPYTLSDHKLARFGELFVDPTYEVNELPSYDPEVASNPFVVFKALPARSRYKFMLDDARFIIMGFIKGPVCRGQVALNVIQDRFWITFVDPDLPSLEAQVEFLQRVASHLDLPAEQGSNAHMLNWLRYASHEKDYLKVKSKYLSQLAKTPADLGLRIIWNGAGENPNAALTVLRHFDSATVLYGFAGDPPKTAWLVGYPLLERIHYLLVAGFDVFGNVSHQLTTRLYMDFMRMEAETNFLGLLPKARRRQLVEFWYRGAKDSEKDHVYGRFSYLDQETGLPFKTKQPEQELYTMLGNHLGALQKSPFALSAVEGDSISTQLTSLANVTGKPASLLSEASFLEVARDHADPEYFTILRDSAHSNVADLFGEKDRRRPKEDRLTVLRGFVGSYPNALFIVHERELATFTELIAKLSSTAAYLDLFSRFGVRRTSPAFWELSDRMRKALAQRQPGEAGLLDYNRLEDP